MTVLCTVKITSEISFNTSHCVTVLSFFLWKYQGYDELLNELQTTARVDLEKTFCKGKVHFQSKITAKKKAEKHLQRK